MSQLHKGSWGGNNILKGQQDIEGSREGGMKIQEEQISRKATTQGLQEDLKILNSGDE